MSELIAIYVLGFVGGTLFGLSIAFAIMILYLLREVIEDGKET